jgi:Protein of unknown function (DUF2637)
MTGMAEQADTPGQMRTAWGLVRDNPVLPVIAVIGFAVSFQTIAGLAKAQHMPGWPVLYPVLIDVFLLGVAIEARRASADGRSDLVPRLITWALAAFTVYVNAHGAPAGDWVGIALHIAAPVAWITFLELARWRKLRRAPSRRDRIPVARWLLSPLTSAGMYRRMVLGNVTSYLVAYAREEARMLALDLTAAVWGKRWKREAPTVLRHQLRAGTLPGDVSRLCETAPSGIPPAVTGPVEAWIAAIQQQHASAVVRARRDASAIEQGAAPSGAPASAPVKRASTRQKPPSARAVKRANAERLLRANPAMSRAELVERTGVSPRTADRIRAEMPRHLHVAEA